MKKYIMFISVPLMGHTNQLIALAEEVTRRGHSTSFVIHKMAEAWITDPRIQFIPWELEPASETSKYAPERDLFWSKISQEPHHWRGKKLMLERVITFYDAMYQSLKLIIEQYKPDCIVVDRAVIPAIDLATQIKLSVIIQTRFLGNLVQSTSKSPDVISGHSIHVNLWQKHLSSLVGRLEQIYLLPTMLKLKHIREQCTHQKGLPSPWQNQTMIVGTSFGIERPRPLPPNVHMVGPIFSRATKPLDAALRDWLESFPENETILYMAFGTLATLTFQQSKVLVEGFIQAGVKVLWSLPEKQHSILPALPSSFRVESFVQQQTLLSHPRIAAFVSHCGMNSINEALYWGKPILALPFFGDQHHNAARLVDLGVALSLNKDKMSSVEVCNKIDQILHCQQFRNNALQMSTVLRQTDGLNQAAHIVEAVLAKEI